jgi:hypothetical protein
MSRPIHRNTTPSVSSAPSKKKFKAFKFIDGVPTIANDDKENDVVESTKQKSATTPGAARLPLTHVAVAQRQNQTSPSQNGEEELQWKQSTPKYSETCSTPARTNTTAANKRKRPVSSSPPSADASGRKFKTPKQDPAADLWSRYCGRTGSREPGSGEALDQASQSKLEQLLIDSSPRSSTIGSVGGLRRYASCGVQFPISAEKKLSSRLERNRSAAHSSLMDAKVSKVSKVGQFLAEANRWENGRRIEDIAKPSENRDGLNRSSSPLMLPPLQRTVQESPLQTRSLNQTETMAIDGQFTEPKSDSRSFDQFSDIDLDGSELDNLFQAASNKPFVLSQSGPIISAPGNAEESDDEFGDINFTEGDLENMDASIVAMTQVPRESTSEQQGDSALRIPGDQASQCVNHARLQLPVITIEDDSDEYDDDIDFEDIVALENQVQMATADVGFQSTLTQG